MKTRTYYWILLIALFSFFAGPSPAQARSALPRPSGPVILTVSGAIGRTNAPGRADFDRAMLQSLGFEKLTTTTAWTVGKQHFEGVSLSVLLKAVGAHGKILSAGALNDYTFDIALAEIKKFHPIIALKHNGAYMAVRDKGPLWIVYPRDDFPLLKNRKYDYRWVWQLRRIDIR